MQVGNLVKYKKSFTNNPDYMGLVIKQNPIYKKFWLIQWLDGAEYRQEEKNLEVVKK